MRKRGVLLLWLAGAVVALLAFTSGAAAHTSAQIVTSDNPEHMHQHGGDDGHLAATSTSNVKVVGVGRVQDAQLDRVADVAALGNYAYLGAFELGNCGGPEGTGPDGGVYVMDISNPAQPRQVGFIKAHQDTYVGEGVQAVRIDTPKFNGDLLVQNNEYCEKSTSPASGGTTGDNGKGGLSLFDVSNPLKPVRLVENVGDFTIEGAKGPHKANQIHSAFAWDAGSKAYVVMTDDMERKDVDILDITDPRKPVLIAEYDLNPLGIVQPELGPFESFLHDMVVKKIGDRYIMLLSYWDGGYVKLDVTDPANAVFVGDTDFTNPDPERAARGETVLPEGNAHQAEFSHDNRYFVAADEDFNPYKFNSRITSGPFAGHNLTAIPGFGSPSIAEGSSLAGESVFVGLACSALPAAPAGVEIAIVERGVCFFSEKWTNVANAGYKAAIVFNRTGSDGCEQLVIMDLQGAQAGIPIMFVSRSDGFRILGIYDPATYTCNADGSGTTAPPAGTPGANLEFRSYFDGWGYVHLYDANTFAEIDSYAISEAQDRAFARGFGDLSVHEVATDPESNVGYLSYYAGGLRVIEFGKTGVKEVGRYIDKNGNNFWGIEVHNHPNGQQYVLASDRDSGLWIFKYTGRN